MHKKCDRNFDRPSQQPTQSDDAHDFIVEQFYGSKILGFHRFATSRVYAFKISWF